MFMVALDPLDPSFDAAVLKQKLKSSGVVKGWWHHIPGCFLLTSSTDANGLLEELRPVTGDARLLIMEVDPARSEGWLPAKSWDWIRRRENEEAVG